jgi:hypothetical protein
MKNVVLPAIDIPPSSLDPEFKDDEPGVPVTVSYEKQDFKVIDARDNLIIGQDMDGNQFAGRIVDSVGYGYTVVDFTGSTRIIHERSVANLIAPIFKNEDAILKYKALCEAKGRRPSWSAVIGIALGRFKDKHGRDLKNEEFEFVSDDFIQAVSLSPLVEEE